MNTPMLELLIDMMSHGCPHVAIQDDCVPRARAELAALRAATRWVPVTERLPEQGNYVLVHDKWEIQWVAFRTGPENDWVWLAGRGHEPLVGITHWQPLPPAPGKDHGPLTPPKETT